MKHIDFKSQEIDSQEAYSNQFSVLLRGKLQGDQVSIEGIMEYQACDASKCFFPRTIEVAFGVPVYLLLSDQEDLSGIY